MGQEDAVRTLRKDNGKLREELSAREVEMQRLKRENYDLASDVKIYKKRLQEFEGMERVSRELDHKSRQLHQMNDELIENDKLLQRFEDELDRKDAKIEKLTVKVGAKEEEIHQLKFKLNEYQKRLEKVSKNETKITLLIEENERLREQVVLKPNNASFDSTGEDSERIKTLELKLTDLLALIERLRAEIENWKKKYEEAMKECKFWEKKRDEIAEKLNNTEILLEKKKEEVMRKIVTVSMLSVKLSILMGGLRASRNKIKQMGGK